MNSEQRDFLNATRVPPVRFDARENGKGGATTQTASGETSFVDEKRLLTRLPISRRTLGNWKAKGILP